CRINRIIARILNLVLADDDGGQGGGACGNTVEPPKALAEGVQARTLGDQGMEVKVGPNFQTLGRDHVHLSIKTQTGIGKERLQATQKEVAIHWSHPASK